MFENCETQTQKYLRIVFDKELKWGAQVSNVCKKISYYITYVHWKLLTFEVLKTLTESLILAELTIPVLGPSFNGTPLVSTE